MKTKKAATPAARRSPRAAHQARDAAPAGAAAPAAAPGGELAAAEAATIDITFADLGLTAPMLKALSRRRLPAPHADPGAGGPARAQGTRHHRPGA